MPDQQLALDLLRPRVQALENFVTGANSAALAAIADLQAGRGPQFLYVWGPQGSGRTHLVASLGGQGGVPNYRRPAGLYAVDDVHLLDDAGQAALFALINEIRADRAARLFATGNAPPAHLTLRPDVRSRLAWGLALPLHPLTESDKADALRTQAAHFGARLSPDLIPYLLAHFPRDMRTLAAALEALDAYALKRRRPLTVPLLREWLQTDDSRIGGE
jgi:DnaA-homolog protein